MKTTLLIVAVILLSGFIFRSDLQKLWLPGNKTEQKEKKEKKEKNAAQAQASPGISVKETWELPATKRGFRHCLPWQQPVCLCAG